VGRGKRGDSLSALSPRIDAVGKKTTALDWLRSKAKAGEIDEVSEEEEADCGGEGGRKKREKKRRSGKGKWKWNLEDG
jgi:hypothetical protein